MCFSATASFSAAAALVVVGGVAASRVRQRSELVYALIPAMFGVQQILEGLIWLALATPSTAPSCLPVGGLTQGYSVFSQVLWPIYVPLSIWLLERDAARRRLLVVTCIFGALVSVFLLNAMFDNPVVAHLQEQHIAYAFSHTHVVSATLLYLLGTCAAPLVSSHASVRAFGVAAMGSAALAYAVYTTWFISVWCFFAGLLSCIVLLHFVPWRRKHKQEFPATR